MEFEEREYGPCEWHEIPQRRLARREITGRRMPNNRWGVNLPGLILFAVMMLAALSLSLLGQAYFSDALGGESDSADSRAASQQSEDGSPAIQSTPRNEWAKGSMPYLYQTDEEWAQKSYADGTVGDSACGPTCMTMAYVYLTGKTDYDPASMAAFSEEKGFVEEGMTSWRFLSEGSRMLGLECEELPADRVELLNAIRAGQPVIVSVRKGDFTDKGHFIVLCGISTDNQIEIRDPNSPERSHQAWDLSRIMSQALNYWAISRP